MIYLITTHDRTKRLAFINSPKDLKTNIWEAIFKLTTHKTVMYPLSTFVAFQNASLPNRVNMVYAQSNKRTQTLPNVLVNNNFKDIVQTFKGSNEDLYIICTTQFIIERFAKVADFIIDFTTEELDSTQYNIFDTINFADYILLKKEDWANYVIRYFVREETNFIGY